MGIALGYAFLLAIAGGLIAICYAWFMDMIEDQARDREEADRRLLPGEEPGRSQLRAVPARPTAWHRPLGAQH